MPHRLFILIACLIEGCAPTYSCKGFPNLAACKSATQAYKATQQIPAEPQEAETSRDLHTSSFLPPLSMSERRDARTMKIWFAPYEDESGDLVGSRVVLSEIEPRRWTLGGSRHPIQKRLTPLDVSESQPRPERTTLASSDRGGFPLFPTSKGPRRLEVEEANDLEP